MNAPNVNRESSEAPAIQEAKPEGSEEQKVVQPAKIESNDSSESKESTETSSEETKAKAVETSSEDSGTEVDDLIARYQKKYFADLTGDRPPPEQTNTQQQGQSGQGPQVSKEDVMSEVRTELQKFSKNQAGGSEKQDPKLVDFFASGDFAGAEAYLQDKAMQKVMSQMDERFASAQNELMERTMTGIQAKITLDSSLRDIMNKSPEVEPFRDFVEYKSEDMIRKAQEQGRIKNVQDYVEAKQAAYATTVQELKKQLTGARGKGKEEALKMKEKTLTSTPVSQGSPGDRSGSESTKGEPAMNNLSVSDYIAARRDRVAKQRGL